MRLRIRIAKEQIGVICEICGLFLPEDVWIPAFAGMTESVSGSFSGSAKSCLRMTRTFGLMSMVSRWIIRAARVLTRSWDKA